MTKARQIILDCNLSGESTCILNQGSAPAIQLQSHSNTSQYHYYLQINNHGTDVCELSFTMENESDTDLFLLSSIVFSLIYQQEILFRTPVSQVFAQPIKLKTLNAHAKDLYQLNWQVKEAIDSLRIDFDINFTFNCFAAAQFSPSAQVLGQQTSVGTVFKSEKPPGHSQSWLIIPVLFSLIVVMFIAVATLLTSSKKGSSHEPEKNH